MPDIHTLCIGKFFLCWILFLYSNCPHGLTDLEKKSSKQDEELQKKNNIVHLPNEQNVELENFKGQLKSQLEEVEGEKKERRKKIAKSEIEKTDENQGLLKEKENLLDVRWKLDERKTNLEKLVMHMKQLLQKMDILISILKK